MRSLEEDETQQIEERGEGPWTVRFSRKNVLLRRLFARDKVRR
jgi:hypothetical protein